MAGETTKTTNLTNIEAGQKVDARAFGSNLRVARDYHAYTTGELEAADVLETSMLLPSNAIVDEIFVYNDDLDADGSPALAIDIGVAAYQDFISTTSSTETKHSDGDVLDADLFVDGATDLQAATTKFTSLALDSGTMGPDDAYKAIWQLLGYDEDPRTIFQVVVTVATAAATAAAGDVVFKVHYSVD